MTTHRERALGQARADLVALLWRWLDRRMYRQLASLCEQDATQCIRNATIQPDRADYWRESAIRYLVQASIYRGKVRVLR